MKVSLILPSYKRPELLDLGLWSLSKQSVNEDLEIIVINDGLKDSTEEISQKYIGLNVKYIFSGHRNIGQTEKFRSPSVAINIGIKEATGDIIILSNPECFHLKNYNIVSIIVPLFYNKNIITTPKNIYFDNTGRTITYLNHSSTKNIPIDTLRDLETKTARCKYASKLPFCMGMYKNKIVDIGGYDEEFSGWACDDDDIVERLILSGLSFHYCEAEVIHLYHDKQYNRENRLTDLDYNHNLELYKKKKGTIIRNQDKEWGVNDG